MIWQNSTYGPPDNQKIFRTLPQSLFAIASQHPNLEAVVTEHNTYTFQDLANRVGGLAAEIKSLGHLKGPVAILQKSGIDAIAAWFACSLSGKTLLLLEPNHPHARLIKLVKKASCNIAIVDQSTSHIFKNSPEVNLLISDGRSDKIEFSEVLSPKDPALIFPTSGSTGNPKLITYSSTTLQVKVQSSIQLMQIPKAARVFIAGSHSNYGFLHHALVFLLSGGSVYLSDIKSHGFNAIFDAVTKNEVKHVRFTPSLFRKLAIRPKAKIALKLLDAVRFSGEPLLKSDLELAKSVLNPNCLIQNVYGSTESALFIWSSLNKTANCSTHTVPIGKIYPYSSFWIKAVNNSDDNTQGELLIKSKFHALGDFNKGNISQDRFPLIEKSSTERIYSTGDIVKQLADGNLIHLGRLGRMVKIRGNRVFLSEIEQQLRHIPGVTGAVVIDKEENENIVLYGFVTLANTTLTTKDISKRLSNRLPDFMIPKNITTIEKIPLMAGGKVDYLELGKHILSLKILKKTDGPRNDFSALVQIWDSALWQGAHKYHSDFFSLGGDSLSYMVLIADIEQKFGKRLSAEKFRANSTIHHLADLLGISGNSSKSIIKYKSIEARLFSSSLGQSKGVAMSVPGFGGLNNAYPFYKAEFFNKYDIWVVEYRINNGNMLKNNRWWIAAQEIEQAIVEGIIPSPKVVFGFSFGGGLAWVIGRLLANSDLTPDFLIIVDAAPIHKRRRSIDRKIKKSLRVKQPEKLPKTLHIRRSTINKFEQFWDSKQKWNYDDNVLHSIDLPTISHPEMIHWELLSLAKEAVLGFLNGKKTDFKWISLSSPLNLPGCQIFYALNGYELPLKKVLNELSADINNLSYEEILNIAILIYNTDKTKSKELIQYASQRWPTYPVVYFLKLRLKRHPSMLFYGDIPKFYPLTMIFLENNLSSSKQPPKLIFLRQLRYLVLAFDAAAAILYSRRNAFRINI